MPIEHLSVSIEVSTDGLGELEELADSLNDVADAQDRVDENFTVDIDVDGLGKLETAEESIDDLDGRTIEVDTDVSGVTPEGDLLAPRYEHDSRLASTGSQIRDTETGQPVSRDEALLSPDIDAASVDIDASHADVDGIDTSVDSGGGGTVMASGGWGLHDPDARLPTGVAIPGFGTPNSVSGNDLSNQLGWLFDDTVERAEPTTVDDLSVDTLDLDEAVDFGSGGATGTTTVADLSYGDDFDLDAAVNFGSDDNDDDQQRVGKFLKQFNLQMSHFYTVIADLIPLFLTFVGAMPAAIAGMMALAGAAYAAVAALGAVGGLATLGVTMSMPGSFGQNIQTITKRVKRQFKEAFAPLARDLAPLFRTALDSMDTFFQNLADELSVLRRFKDDIRALMDIGSRALPKFLGNVARLAHQLMPAIRGLARRFAEMNVVRIVARYVRRLGPPLIKLLATVVKFLPEIIALSLGFLKVATVLVKLISIIGKALGHHRDFLVVMGALIGTTFTAISVLATLGNAIAGVSTAMEYLAASSITASTALYTLLGVLGVVAVLLGSMAFLSNGQKQMQKFGGAVGDANDRLREFKGLASSIGRTSVGFNGGLGTGTNVNYVNFESEIHAHGKNASEAVEKAQYEQRQWVDQYFAE